MSASRIDDVINSEFGLNASYVADLYRQFAENPQSVDEDWRAFFEELVQDQSDAVEVDGNASRVPDSNSDNGAAATAPARAERTTPTTAPTEPSAQLPFAASPAPAKPETAKAIGPDQAPQFAAPPPGAAAGSPSDGQVLRGPALRLAQNMEASLAVPTATSQRQIPIKLLEENRALINKFLKREGRKVSYTHLIARAILEALDQYRQMTDSYVQSDGAAYRVRHLQVNLGIAVDVTKKDGSRSLLVPNIKNAGALSFAELLDAYDAIVTAARDGKLKVPDFENTTISLTNPGTIGTTASNPRLMSGQGLIVATGAIGYPPEYSALAGEAIARLGISKVMTITSTYDHRIIQGAESGAFLARIDELLRGKDEFYDRIFSELKMPLKPYRWATDFNPGLLGEERHQDEIRKQARVLQLINAYRVRGHLIADQDPLGSPGSQYHPELDIETYGLTIWDLERRFITDNLVGETATLGEILDRLRTYYCGKIGTEYRHISGPAEKEWIRGRIEREQPAVPIEVKRQILWKLTSAELFERFLGTKYLGQKRFSIEGAETVVALLDQLIEESAARGIDDITVGMSHRGRLNVIANVIGKFCERIFTSFEGSTHPKFPHDQGDVKYHQGASGVRDTAGGKQVTLGVLPNPSHLEFVDPVVEGVVRAKQDMRDGGDRDNALAVLIHGDAAFAGEGIVPETLNLSQLHGYGTGGTIHIIVNNQLGFTTTPEEGRSSTYSTDVAKMIQAPIFHVNGDDPEAAWHTLLIALDYRLAFHKDVVIDVIGFRKHGHNEGDEPSYTQPVMYKQVKSHPGVRELYTRALIRQGDITREEADSLIEERTRRYENALLGAKAIVARSGEGPAPLVYCDECDFVDAPEEVKTAVPREDLLRIAAQVATVPKGFNLNPKITGLLARRAKMVEGELAVDFGMSEALAFGSLLEEGVPVRLSGQDSVRGTFSHRHATFFDTQTDAPWTPLADLSSPPFQVYDSPLSEAGVLGFEYGYSVVNSRALVLWEAQFGDFLNAAQVIVDQFIASGEEKWDQKSRLVLLLPHGYEGQGPEHSSARLERFLQITAGGNIRVTYPSTAGQYFHLLRRQALSPESKPLIVMTPKSLLRIPEAGSPIGEFEQGEFQLIIPDPLVSLKGSGGQSDATLDRELVTPGSIDRVLICTGKIYHHLADERRKVGDNRVGIIRVEQLYPFPRGPLATEIHRFANARDLRWVQEEPKNMGAWSFIEMKLREMLGPGQSLTCVARPARASTATGSHTIHQMEHRNLIKESLAPRQHD